MAGSDPHDLAHFLEAQRSDYGQALSELRRGEKRSHWIWFIFPQIDGLGMSAFSRRYSIKSLEEARAYLDHPVLGARLRECAEALLGLEGRTANEVLGSPDDLKVRSSATLFARVSPPGSVFEQLLGKYYQGRPDPRTLELLAILPPAPDGN